MAKTIFRKKKKRKSAAIIVILVCLLVTGIVGGILCKTLWQPAVETPEEPEESITTTTTVPRQTLPKEFIDRNTFSGRVMLYDVTAGEVLYSKQPDEKCAPASLTKLMTALVAVKYTPKDYVFTVGEELRLVLPGSSVADLWMGNQLNLTQMLQALLMKSGNDAAYVIGVQVGRLIAGDENLGMQEAVKEFCKEMNAMAKELGCKNTNFENPDGYHKDKHLTTAADMLKICIAALEDPVIAPIVATDKVDTTLVSGRQISWKNSNLLLDKESRYYYEGVTGLKTGTTDEAGYCLAASATRDGHTTIAVVLGATDENGRWEDARGLLDLSFQ